MKKVRFSLASALLSTLLLAGCAAAASTPASSASSSVSPASASGSPSAAQQPVSLTLAAAASLEQAFSEELIPLFQSKYPHITVTGNYASSGKLQTQIEEGLAADVFMSAAQKQMTALTEQGLIEESSVVPLLENQVVLILPEGSETGIVSFEDLPKAATIAMGDPESVPAGQYAKEILENLGLWETLQPRLTLGTDVTQVLNWVAESSADAGIVYATDAAQMPDKVQVVAAAPEGSLATPVIYPVGIGAAPGSPNHKAAELFVAFLQSPEAMAVFKAKGFIPYQ